ncbi:MAG TPA: formylglycine-generating enzyme family protein [Candidatus Wunengus sp. YC63]|uniref:formylglycine-generating enzyme family protein n=1 Tax=Candidatus Wunengus sp. YC63 TaxID=3367699 RepID=UPI0040297351
MKKHIFLLLLLITALVINSFTSKPIHADQLSTIKEIYEDRSGVQTEVDVLLPSGSSKTGIMPGSKGSVYTIDEYDKTESLIADIEVIRITPDGLVRAIKTGGSGTIKIKEGDIVRFEPLERAKWDKLLADIKVNYYNLLKLNGDGNTLPKMKVAAWKEFVSKSRVDQDNPYTDEDDKMHKQAGLFIEEWEAEEKLEGGALAGKTWRDPITGMEFVWVPGGNFEMGDLFGEGNADEKDIHQVTITGFWMGKYEVTQGLWKKFMDDNPSHFKNGDDYPVENISWNDIQEFIKKINALRRWQHAFRLPSEAEWEYACREGGKKVRFGNGHDILDPQKANFNGDGRYKESYSLAGEYRKKTTPVGAFLPNNLGLHDMSGNVWEWTQDSYKPRIRNTGRENQSNDSIAACRVIRGGSWNFRPYFLRATYRDYFPSDAKLYDCGFRLVLSANKQNDTKIIR